MAYNGKFFIQDKLDKPFKHHESFKQLWETKWKKPVGETCIRLVKICPDHQW